MTHHQLNVEDKVAPQDVVADAQAPANAIGKSYTVISEQGLYKRGEQYDKGSKIELDDATAQAFISNGDIE